MAMALSVAKAAWACSVNLQAKLAFGAVRITPYLPPACQQLRLADGHACHGCT